jgi:hypothetical protein
MSVSSVFWKRIGDEWLKSRTACMLFAIASALIIVLSLAIAMLGIPSETEVSPISRFAWGLGGCLGPVSVFFLWSGMWKYWKDCDPSSRFVRRGAFLLLLVGVWYGAILYFLLIYLPNVTKRGGFGRKVPR